MSKTIIPGSKGKKPARFSRHPQPGLAVKGRVWLERDGELYIGFGRVMLLERIDQLGSISAAAKSMKLGYRNAWLWVEALNRLSPAPLVEKTTGGSGGGHARLTEAGRKLLSDYKALNTRFQEFLEQVA